MLKNVALLLALSGLVTGCVSTPEPPINFSVPDVQQAAARQAIELKSISVSYGLPNEIKGNIPSYGGGYPMLWEKSLAEAIDKSRVFTDDSYEKVNIFVKVLELAPPLGGGLTMVTPARARYTIVSRRTGKTLFEKEIYTQGTVTSEYAFSGRTRLKESLNRSVQANISEFLQSLSAVKL
ncbi:UDP-N-acetylglucosamine acyltransferase [Pseudomonas syringae]|nr:UDP-N-acetylglucosamine acyltransferase [Pseudomonas syringae]MCF5468535.1 UDP-N-acetylglucosamine acyltransferase [Pseudomonas syringae]MCF5473122.1 UDP-N-acetylglucosamine acyltransferase [Pseudomonas syringae]MCF5483137.1 UDP-N-acetylglucosamine acyltransferase [Pseudomonas syringae]MCF5487558.1 UDP-N-acetylglucosamine acyltransferase [Pseudomonas syringae]MCF5492605.1 UDP-N-acetylglucosamine acyltransferase [Pseudomonas syringae]